jgi:hypothetical protein
MVMSMPSLQWLVLTLPIPLVLCCAVLQVDHHKKVVCLVCSSVVVPYEAYHIDAGEKGRAEGAGPAPCIVMVHDK